MSLVNGQVESFPQRDGPEVQLRVFGDEFYARYETLDGYAAVHDGTLGRFCYALLDEGAYVSSGTPVDRPPPAGIEPHLKESAGVRSTTFDRRIGRALPPQALQGALGQPEVFGPNKGLLNGRTANSGSVRGLTVLVNFQDVEAAIEPSEVEALLNAEGYRGHGNACSVRDYYATMSAGRLDYQNVVVGPITLGGRRHEYVDTLLAAEALSLVTEQGIDLAQFDSRGEGILDAVSFFYAGETLYEGWLWPHNHFLEWSHDGYQTNFYQISALGLRPSQLKIGTFCHESGHMLCRFPDLYDYGRRDEDMGASAGLGTYCLMSSGNHLGEGKSPSPICAYLRYLTGWVEEEVLLDRPGTYTVRHGDYGRFFIFRTPRANEYFLIENRSRRDLDTFLPSSGLAVYHCDILGSNEWQGNTAEQHYQCGLLQADALSDLERNANAGDEGDLFRTRPGAVLTEGTTPHTRLWDGSDSGLRIHEIGDDGDAITFRVEMAVAAGPEGMGEGSPVAHGD